jgi:RNA polymerase subunit RPABC4/transcription elongation factor Spt4
MPEQSGDFVPYSSPMPIPGSSYSAQVGKVQERWALRLVKGREVLDTGYFNELNGNQIIAYIIQSLAIPMINPYQISQSVKALIKQAEHGPLTAQAATGARAEAVPGGSGEMGAAPAVPSGVMTPTDNACPRCRRPIQSNFYFCPYCSQALRAYQCVACKKDIRLDYVMCPYCGVKL